MSPLGWKEPELLDSEDLLPDVPEKPIPEKFIPGESILSGMSSGVNCP